MKLLSFLLAASLLFLGCKKVTTTTIYHNNGIFEVSKSLYHYKDINGQDSMHIDTKATFMFTVFNYDGPYFGYGGLLGIGPGVFDSSILVKVNDSLLQCLGCTNGSILHHDSSVYSSNFPNIDSPLHCQFFGGNSLENYSYTYPAPFPYYNITFPDTIHYHQGITLPCSFTNADSVCLHFYNLDEIKTITFTGNINSINITPNIFANVQDSALSMIMEVYNQHTELVNGNHYIFRKVNYVQASTIIVP